MLFNSYQFIFLFLPITLTLFFIIKRDYAIFLLSICSIIFYAQWDMLHLSLLLSSIAINYTLARYITITKPILFGSIALNLAPLIFFKYSSFLHLSTHSLILPLAISFYTFQQIAFLVDIYTKKTTAISFKHYIFFILFFPQLIAGPIVHYNYISSQIKNLLTTNIENLKAGTTLFVIGLFNKIVLADSLVRDSYHSIYDLFSYSFMIYFDFSGYANMAIGLALLFGITLPTNFASPYKSRNIIDFWRRWHITLSTFLRDHIYIPLGGSKNGLTTQIFALLATMTIGGIWHGSGWHFMLWGFLHGVALVVVHMSRFTLPRLLSIAITFIYVTLLWVLFFSPSLTEAITVYTNLHHHLTIVPSQLYLLIISAVIIFFTPSAHQIIKKPLTHYHAVFVGIALFISLKFLAATPPKTFVYFNF